MSIDPAKLASGIGALDTLSLESGLARTLQQVLDSAKALFDADRAGLMLVDHAGALRWASASDQVAEPVAADQERLAQGPCMLAFAQRAPVAVRDLSAEPGWRDLAALSVPVQVGGGPVGTLDVHVTAPREWDDSQVAALQAYAGLVASLLAAAGTARVRGRLADQLQGALEHRLLIEQAEAVLFDREGLDGQAAFEWLRTAARSAGCAVVEVAGEDYVGAVVGWERTYDGEFVRLEDRRGVRRLFQLLNGGFLLDGQPVTLIRHILKKVEAPRRSNSGSRRVENLEAKVAAPSRIWVEGLHDAELVEKVWGEDLRLEGIVVEPLHGVDDLAGAIADFSPGPQRRLGILVDHLVSGSKEERIAAEAMRVPGARGNVLIVGHPYVDVWQVIKPAVLGIEAWPVVPKGQDWKTGILKGLGWPHRTKEDVGLGWKRLLSRVRTYADLEPALLGRVEEVIDFLTAVGD